MNPSTTQPLVTVAIPTFRRPALLKRAIQSALAQTHSRLEILVADDCSGDSTQSIVERLSEQDPRIRLVSHQENLGHAANYQWTLANARGEYFMWLSDDDYIDRHYIEACLTVLRKQPGAIMATGQAHHIEPGRAFVERPTRLLHKRRSLRILHYFCTVDHNSGLFGVARTAGLRQIGFRPGFGGDWELMAQVACRSEVPHAADARIVRSLGGLSSDASALSRTEFAMDGLKARWPHVVLARHLARSIARGTDNFDALQSRLRRSILAGVVYAIIVVRFVVLGEVVRALSRLGAPANAPTDLAATNDFGSVT